MPNSLSYFFFHLCAACFVGFGVYSPFYFYFRWKSPGKTVRRWDADACTMAITAGICYAAIWISEALLSWIGTKPEQSLPIIQALNGPQGYLYWGGALFYLAVSQSLWIKPVRELAPIRIIVATVLAFGLYPLLKCSGIAMPVAPVELTALNGPFLFSRYLVVDILLKTIVFLALLATVFLLRKRRSKKTT